MCAYFRYMFLFTYLRHLVSISRSLKNIGGLRFNIYEFCLNLVYVGILVYVTCFNDLIKPVKRF